MTRSVTESLPIARFVDGDGNVRAGRFDGTSLEDGNEVFAVCDVRFLPPSVPSKVIGVGLNYRSHAYEVGMAQPDEPTIFLKPPSSLVGHLEDVQYPPNVTQVDYEGELAVVIGRRASRVAPTGAPLVVAGYCIANDYTARELQVPGAQWTLAKGFDTFAAVGPALATLERWDDRDITTTVNGEVRQHASTSDLIFGVPELVSYISHFMTLEPGDVILTGTPPGVGPVDIGDVVEVTIDGLGALTNRIVGGRGDELSVDKATEATPK